MTQSEQKKFKELYIVRMFAQTNFNGSEIARRVGVSRKVVNKLMQRIKKNGTLVVKPRGGKRKITGEMIDFLKNWCKVDTNVGKSFKHAYAALVE